MKYLQEYFEKDGKNCKYARLVKQEKVKSQEALKTFLKEVEGKGGEGLMLRKPGSMYVGQRSNTLLKVKSFFDAEAKILRVSRDEEIY
jgi:DNA ligase-1